MCDPLLLSSVLHCVLHDCLNVTEVTIYSHTGFSLCTIDYCLVLIQIVTVGPILHDVHVKFV